MVCMGLLVTSRDASVITRFSGEPSFNLKVSCAEQMLTAIDHFMPVESIPEMITANTPFAKPVKENGVRWDIFSDRLAALYYTPRRQMAKVTIATGENGKYRQIEYSDGTHIMFQPAEDIIPHLGIFITLTGIWLGTLLYFLYTGGSVRRSKLFTIFVCGLALVAARLIQYNIPVYSWPRGEVSEKYLTDDIRNHIKEVYNSSEDGTFDIAVGGEGRKFHIWGNEYLKSRICFLHPDDFQYLYYAPEGAVWGQQCPSISVTDMGGHFYLVQYVHIQRLLRFIFPLLYLVLFIGVACSIYLLLSRVFVGQESSRP